MSRVIEFKVRLLNEQGVFVTDAMMGRYSLAVELEHLPVGWTIEVKRIDQPVDDIEYLSPEGAVSE